VLDFKSMKMALLALVFVFILGFVPHAFANSNGPPATLVLGQTGFTSNGFATTKSGLNFPENMAFDSHGNLWVADEDNNRVLEYAYPFYNGMNASLVIGQSGFTTSSSFPTTASNLNGPSDVAFDSSGNLWVVDQNNYRVLEYVPGTSGCPTGQFCNGMSASLVIGQPVLTLSEAQSGAYGFACPAGEAFDSSGNLWVVDPCLNRVLEFTYPFSTFEPASLVIGQSGFTAYDPATSQSGLSAPNGIAFDSSGNLWVADEGNNRVLEYLIGSGFSTGMSASLVIGQTGFTTHGYSDSALGLKEPSAVAFDSSGNLWVTDYDNSRVLEYLIGSGFSTGMSASLVIGQTGFGSNAHSTTATGLTYPTAAAFDSSGNLWVADQSNNRVLGYGPVSVTPYSFTFDQTGIPSSVTWGVTVGSTDHTGTGGSITVTGIVGAQTYSYDSPVAGTGDTQYSSSCSGSLSAAGTLSCTYYATPYSVTFSQYNYNDPAQQEIPNSVTWGVNVGGNEYTGTGPSITVNGIPGTEPYTYDMAVTGATGVQYQCYSDFDCSGTVTPSTTTESAPYLTYFQVSFAVSPPGSGAIDPSATAYYVQGGSFGVTATAASGYLFSSFSANTASIPIGSPSACSASMCASVTINGPGTITANFAASYSVTFDQTGIPGTVQWGVTVGGQDNTGTGSSITVNSLSGTVSYSYDSPITGASGARYLSHAPTCSGSVTGAGSQSCTYAVQYQVTFSLPSGLGADATGTVLTINSTDNYPYSQLPVSVWVWSSSGTTFSFTPTVPGGAGIRYVFQSSSQGSPLPTLSSPLTISSSYLTQYQVSFAVSPPSSGTTLPSATAYYSAGYGLPISAAPSGGYEFSSWSNGGASIAFDSSTSSSTTATISGPGTITANFVATGLTTTTTITVTLPTTTTQTVSTTSTATTSTTTTTTSFGSTVSTATSTNTITSTATSTTTIFSGLCSDPEVEVTTTVTSYTPTTETTTVTYYTTSTGTQTVISASTATLTTTTVVPVTTTITQVSSTTECSTAVSSSSSTVAPPLGVPQFPLGSGLAVAAIGIIVLAAIMRVRAPRKAVRA